MMNLAVSLLVDEEDLLLFVFWGSFSSKTLFFLLEADESLESLFEMARSLQKLGHMMGKAWVYNRGMRDMAWKHFSQGGESFK